MAYTLPQLDTTYIYSQIFWLAISFSIIYVFISLWFIPKIQSILLLRQNKIGVFQNELNKLHLKLDSLKKEYNIEVNAIEQHSDEVKQNILKEFELKAAEQCSSLNQSANIAKQKAMQDIALWETNLEKDIEQLSLKHIQYIVNKALKNN